jgi:pimeloyl-ACP methyl ester carboxylesterase
VDESRSAAAPQELARQLITVVTVHGLWMHGRSMAVLRRRIEARGFAVYAFSYPSVTVSLEANAVALAKFLEGVPGDRVHIVAHSLGGVLFRAMLDRHVPQRLGHVVMLGSPLRGSLIAARLARLPGHRWLIGKGFAELNARGGFDAWDPTVVAGGIAGRLPYGAGRLTGGFDEPNDGTVAVRETQLPGLADHVVLPVSHSALLWSRRVSVEVESFLETGRFRPVASQSQSPA